MSSVFNDCLELRSNCAEARIGDEYQANLDWAVYSPHEADRDQCVWRPSAAVNPDHLRNFLEWIKTERDIAEDEALYILHQSDYSIEKAMERLQQLVQRKISPKTMRIFKNGFQQCRRRFSINQMKLVLPHLSSRRLVDLYCLAKGGDVRLLYNVNDFHWSSSKKYDLNGSKFVEQIGKLSVAIQKQMFVLY
ncbi:unnamed protein product [Anisakis simplex]|uniref:ELM2 domain-containing protein n=1 Tax=Anisakis simplex TaxID=6269 RepID=A0A0M3JW66_ANISI|nr:unnamed protein product [Anisakis simplex]